MSGKKSYKQRKTEDELVERVKKILFFKGRQSSETMNEVLKDLALLSKPYNHSFQRKNDITPFEDATSLEFLAPKNGCGLFVMASHSKKRPNNLVLVSEKFRLVECVKAKPYLVSVLLVSVVGSPL